jgi:serine/threonine-protein kinase
LDKALADFNQAIQLNPNDAKSYTNRGLVYQAQGDYDKDLADDEQALLLDAKSITAYNNLAWLYATCPEASVRDGKKAVENATKAWDLSEGKSPYPLDTLAAACAEAGDFDNALKWERQYLQSSELSAADTANAQSRLTLYQDHQPYHAEK